MKNKTMTDDSLIAFNKLVDASNTEIVIWVSYEQIHCYCASANEYNFSVSLTELSLEDRAHRIELLLRTIPIIQNVDAALAKAYDNAFGTCLNAKNIYRIRALIKAFPSLQKTLGHLVK